MTWFKVDDRSAFNAKVLKAGNEAFGAWTRAGAWTSSEGKDGFIPDETADLIAKKRVWEQCAKAGLLERVEGGWHIAKYLEYNPSAAQVATKREARAQAGARGGRKSGEVRGGSKPEANDEAIASVLASHANEPPSRPGPTRPISPPSGESAPAAAPKSQRGSRLPAGWTPSAETVAALRQEGVADPLACLPAFRDYWPAQPGQKGVKLDWEGTYRNWVRRDHKPVARPSWQKPSTLQGHGDMSDWEQYAATGTGGA